MGEIADMMVEGVMCPCGEYIGEDAPGHPRYCSPQCQRDYGGPPIDVNEKPPRNIRCPEQGCERKFRSRDAAAQHWRDKHG